MELNNNAYYAGGVKLTDVAQEFGTPVYVYNADKIISQYKRLKNAFNPIDIKIKYACKALNNSTRRNILHSSSIRHSNTFSPATVRITLTSPLLRTKYKLL